MLALQWVYSQPVFVFLEKTRHPFIDEAKVFKKMQTAKAACLGFRSSQKFINNVDGILQPFVLFTAYDLVIGV